MKSRFAREHTYRIVVSDLIRKRPNWFGGEDRSEACMAMFSEARGTRKSLVYGSP